MLKISLALISSNLEGIEGIYYENLLKKLDIILHSVKSSKMATGQIIIF